MQIITTEQLALQDKGSAIKGLDVCNSWESNALGPALFSTVLRSIRHNLLVLKLLCNPLHLCVYLLLRGNVRYSFVGCKLKTPNFLYENYADQRAISL